MEIIKITKIPEKEQKLACRWGCKQNYHILYEIGKVKKQYFHKYKSLYANLDMIILDIAAQNSAVYEIYSVLHKKSIRNKNIELKNIKSFRKIYSAMVKKVKNSPKFEKLLNYQKEIVDMIEIDKLSYREVAQHLNKKRHLSVSHTLVGKFYHAIKNV